ncbi:MAG: leucine-rich repeat domain-containing protein, partial [Alphaproteobacteria bacterium]|nr:leucine-rich repeat domain-containing protein [Alphaproteobacteria bacterium]
GLNEIHRFPQGVVSLPNLEHLDLSHNPIESCPLQILKLKKLKTLDLNNTNILAIPDQIKRSGVKIFFDKKPPTA